MFAMAGMAATKVPQLSSGGAGTYNTAPVFCDLPAVLLPTEQSPQRLGTIFATFGMSARANEQTSAHLCTLPGNSLPCLTVFQLVVSFCSQAHMLRTL